MLERLDRQVETQAVGQRAAVAVQVVEHAGVVAGVGDDADMGVVLGRRAHHGGAADIDVLDGVLEAAVGPGHGLFERVEVDHHQIDGANVVIRHHRIVLAAPAEDAAMHLGVQGFHPAVHHFREAGVVGHFAHRDAGFLDGAESAAGGQQLHPPVGEGAGEIDDAGFIGDADQRAFNGLAHGCHLKNKKGAVFNCPLSSRVAFRASRIA